VRHVRMLGLCLVAVLAFGAYAVSSASAGSPEWGKCVAKAGGKYTNSNCTTKGKGGSFEWLKASQVAKEREAKGKSANVPFSGGSVESTPLLTTDTRQCSEGLYKERRVTRQKCIEGGGREYPPEGGGTQIGVECESETNTGEAVGKDGLADVKATFKGCVLFGYAPCHSAGAEEGEIETNVLKGSLGYINKSAKEVGVLLEPAKKKGAFAEFTCIGVFKIVVGAGNSKEGTAYTSSNCFPKCQNATPAEEKHGGYDGITSPITPVNTMTSTYEQVFKVDKATDENIPGKLEGKHIDDLESYLENIEEGEKEASLAWNRSGEELTNVNTSEEAGEIKA
jgi:hypothetical protein